MKERASVQGILCESKPLRIARYLRVSKLDQDPQLQGDESAQFVAARGWVIVDTYLDYGVSGARERRAIRSRRKEGGH